MNKIDDFLDFEKRYSLFDLVDEKENFIWDVFRYYISFCIYGYEGNSIKNGSKKRNIFSIIKIMLNDILPIKRDIFFYLSSRNKIGSKNFDQNSYATLLKADKKNTIIYESYQYKNLVYNGRIFGPQLLSFYKKFFYKKQSSDLIVYLYNLVKKEFSITLDISVLNQLYNDFLASKQFYEFFFKYHGVKKIFITQNGIQKGFFAAAKKLQILTYEFQHGTVDKGHMAYSYPDIPMLLDKVYLPTKILSFSSFWFSEFYCPVPRLIIGNDYFAKTEMKLGERKNILVISADVFGHELVSVVKSIRMSNKNAVINFKLHPNEFSDINYYQTVFAKDNINIITNEFTVPQLLEKTKIMLTVCSTAAYEALQNGIPVIIYKGSMYEEMSNIFSCEGVYISDDNNEICETVENISSCNPTVFFSKKDDKVIGEILK